MIEQRPADQVWVDPNRQMDVPFSYLALPKFEEPKMQTFIAGFLGGTSPTLAMAGGYAAAGDIPPLAAGISAAIFGSLGGIVAYYTSGRDKRAAFVAGVAAPGIISSLIAGFNDGRLEKSVSDSQSSSLFTTSAFAQEAPLLKLDSNNLSELRIVILNTEISGGIPTAGSLDISGILASGGNAVPIATLPITPGASSISIPADVTDLFIDGQSVDLGNSGAIRVTVETSPTFWGDVAWGFGGNRNFEVEAITAFPMGQ